MSCGFFANQPNKKSRIIFSVNFSVKNLKNCQSSRQDNQKFALRAAGQKIFCKVLGKFQTEDTA